MWAMPIKSWLTNESQLFGNRHILRGVAMGGERAVEKVEVSIDGGKIWKEAPFVGPDLGPFAWRMFQLSVALLEGEHLLMCRAYNDQGGRQSETRHENERGYGHNGWKDHALKVNVYAEEQRDKIKESTALAKPQPKIEAQPKSVELSAQGLRGKKVF